MKDPNKQHPETLMMSYGYHPEWSEGAVKCPIFQTSTFAFNSAEEGKAFFELAYGLREKKPREELGLIYSRLNNPDLEILEDRLKLWDRAEDCAVFESGMSAISSTMMEFLRPGDLLLHSAPLYGGTDHFIRHIITRYGIKVLEFRPNHSKEEIIDLIRRSDGRLAMIYIETPGNPTNDLIDIEMCAEIANLFGTEEHRVILAVDNTFMGPIWSHPIDHGADLVLYSATKYIGGHSDVIAGACLGSKELIGRVKAFRTFVGNMAGPWTGWLLMRSLETLKIRIEKQTKNAEFLANKLKDHPAVKGVHYLGLIRENDPQYKIYKKQYKAPGAMISIDLIGGESEAFMFLNNLHLIKLAVSLGSTESLAQHPYTMTHVDVAEEEKMLLGLTPSMVRISVGIEHPDDLWEDIESSLDLVLNSYNEEVAVS
jgi:methionine-gamma-lyase